MNKPPVPDDVRQFILDVIPSVPFLEALLLMHQSPAHAWTAGELAQQLYQRPDSGKVLLELLTQAGLARCEAAAYRYAPAYPELAAAVDRLAEAYSRNLVEISTLIHTRKRHRAREFAQAFRWKAG